jgi:sugar/nucleoside kinase (ribokinase family)
VRDAVERGGPVAHIPACGTEGRTRGGQSYPDGPAASMLAGPPGCGGRCVCSGMMPPSIPAPRRLTRSRRRPDPERPSVVVLGDLVVDVVLAPDREIERGTDVTGRVLLRQGGSAASTARWLGRLGARVTLVSSIGRDATGRALVTAMTGDKVVVRAVRVAGARTGRIGVFVEPGGQRSFVTDRGAALRLRPEDLKAEWFAGADVLHLPAYSLLDQPLGRAGMVATRMAREAGALVTLDLSSSGPLLEHGRRAALALVREAAPDLLFGTRNEARALLGAKRDEGDLLDLAPVAVVKRGKKGATILLRDGKATLRFEVATTPLKNVDTTGAGDAFNAGFLAAWLDARRRGLAPAAALQRGAVGGNRCAFRHLSSPQGELALG